MKQNTLTPAPANEHRRKTQEGTATVKNEGGGNATAENEGEGNATAENEGGW